MELKSENKHLIFDKPQQTGAKQQMKNIYHMLKKFRYELQERLYVPEVKDKKYNVSVLAIFKNEARYFREWIEFHRIVGVEHFYLYNNNSNDDYEQVLKPYIDEDIVSLIPWPKNQAQMECYADGIEKFKNETKWMAIIDIDEFIIPNETDNIYDFLSKYENRPAVIGYWKYFGASGKVNRDAEGLVTEDFIVSWRKYADIGKCFLNTAYDVDYNSDLNLGMHHFMWANCKGHNMPPVNVFGKVCLPGDNPIPAKADPSHFPLQINHYFTKTYQEYIDKKSKGDVYYKENPHTFDYFYEHDMPSQSADYHAYKYLIKLKLAMENSNGRK